MSVLLNEIIQDLKAKRLDYEEYLKQIAELAKQVQMGQAETMSEQLDTPGRRVLYNNLDQNEALAMEIDDAVKEARPDAWRGEQAREQVVKGALYDTFQDFDEVERIFAIIKQQQEY
jgi:type I restriction enzyme R subunit